MCFKVFSKFPHRFQSFSKLCSSKCFQNGFNGFQNYAFQSVFKIAPQVSLVFKMMCFKVFSKFPIGFNAFQSDVFQKCFQNGFNAFQNDVFQKCFQNGFNAFQNDVFQSVFKISP